ncbi:MAG TPA: T9SS type A sorting domain-containing protein [Bacteroidia bacterium]|nr:T9SS type A sorting domain-containing protein [Bacteroidia bacterium]
MKSKKIKFCALLVLGFGLSTAEAQEASTASGGDASGSGGSVSYSVGQLVYTAHSGTNGSVAEGVQQPFEISVVTSLNDEQNKNLSLFVYPNPTTESVTLKVNDIDKNELVYQLFDMNGKEIKSEKINTSETNISMKNVPSAVYFIKVITNNKVIKMFKIIKN